MNSASATLRGCIVMVSYNEASAIGPVLAEIEEAASVLSRSGISLDVLLVDDRSPDDTATAALEQASRLGLKLEVVTGQPHGPGNAFLRGFEHAFGLARPILRDAGLRRTT